MAGFFSSSLEGDSSKLEDLDPLAAMAKWARTWSRAVTAELVNEAPVGTGDGSGGLRDSIHEPPVETGLGRVSMTWTSDKSYAEYVLAGTSPHPIYPKNAKALHWDDVFAAYVNHPGTQPNPFPQRAIDHLLPELTASLAALFEEL